MAIEGLKLTYVSCTFHVTDDDPFSTDHISAEGFLSGPPDQGRSSC